MTNEEFDDETLSDELLKFHNALSSASKSIILQHARDLSQLGIRIGTLVKNKEQIYRVTRIKFSIDAFSKIPYVYSYVYGVRRTKKGLFGDQQYGIGFPHNIQIVKEFG